MRDKIYKLRDKIYSIAKRYGVVSVQLFGSVARGDHNKDSDIDLLIELEKGRGLLDHAGFMVEMQNLLGVKVDVVTKNGLKDHMRDQVLREAVSI